jgi:SNF2 family DNA or RNA helicase
MCSFWTLGGTWRSKPRQSTAHGIGQSQRVFAYRLITRNTVEEKVLALQSTKRDLADAIIGANENLIRNITKDDLMLLLS